MKNGKKYISPGAWFSMIYPADWNEFEDGEGSFLFYNPNEWNGNFRISAYKGKAGYGRQVFNQELAENSSSKVVRIGEYQCAYNQETFQDEGIDYTTHHWIIDADELAFECSFTKPKGGDALLAETVISTLEVRHDGIKYPAEIIPVRLLEIYQINEAYEWVSHSVKEQLKKDFQGVEEDVPHMQELIRKLALSPKKKEAWVALGIVLCVILSNEADGMEWQTLMDGNREAPVLIHTASGHCIDPMTLVWSKVKAGEQVDLVEVYKNLL